MLYLVMYKVTTEGNLKSTRKNNIKTSAIKRTKVTWLAKIALPKKLN